jgi:hypothetical protein
MKGRKYEVEEENRREADRSIAKTDGLNRFISLKQLSICRQGFFARSEACE